MSRYFFDVIDDSHSIVDGEGTVLPGEIAAREEAIELLAQLAHDYLPDNGMQQHIAVKVRNGDGRQVMKATVDFWIET